MPPEPPSESSDAGDDNRDRPVPNPFAGTPFESIFGGLTDAGPAQLHALFGSLQQMFGPHPGAVSWDLVRNLARQVVASSPGGSTDRSPDAGDRARLQDVARLAEHWLDGATDLPAASATIAAWSRAEWVEAGMPVWQRLVEPIAESVVAGMAEALPSEMKAMAGPMLGMLNSLGSAVFSQQVGQAVGGLAGEVVSATDLGIPVSPDGRPALVLANATRFAEGLGVEESDVVLYLVLRECAHQRLYLHAPWLREHLFGAIEEYGRGITIDTSKIQETVSSLDPSNLQAMQELLSGGLFEVEPTPAQQAALSRLETALALVEGWVDDVVGQAAGKAMPQAGALREAVRRRRASGGPAEATFAALVGLELRPRRLRDAAALWGALRSAEGAAGRDAVWAHPDLLPTAADLDDPLAYASRTREADSLDVESAEFDAALTALLEGDRPDSDAPGSAAAGEPGETGETGDGTEPGEDRPGGSPSR